MTRAGVSERRRASVGELTPDRLAELRWVAEAATPGPWERRYVGGENCWPYIESAGAIQRFICRLGIDDGMSTHDGEYIATFDPPTVLALLDEIERLRRMLDSVADIAAAALDHVRKRYSGDSDSFGDIEEALLDAGLTMDDLDPSPGLGQAREDVLALLDGEKSGDRCE